jgi:hypothetical protein
MARCVLAVNMDESTLRKGSFIQRAQRSSFGDSPAMGSRFHKSWLEISYKKLLVTGTSPLITRLCFSSKSIRYGSQRRDRFARFENATGMR